MSFSDRARRAFAALWAAAALLVLAATGGCGGGADRTKAHLRLVNASGGYAALDLRIEGQLRQRDVAYGADAGSIEVDTDETSTVITRSGSATALVSLQPGLQKNKHYTLLAFGGEGALRHLLLDENTAAPASGRVLLRVMNAASDAGNLDIYLSGPSEPLASAVPVQAAASYGELKVAPEIASGSWRLRVTAAGSKTDVRLDIAVLALPSQQVATLVLTPSRSGALVAALLLRQQGALARLDLIHSRVRVLAGLAESGIVGVTLGGTVLTSDVGSPAIGAYMLTPAGTPPLAISANGASVAAPNTVLAVGADYSLLVYGTPAAPEAAWIEDLNVRPTVSGKVRIRLVNASSGLAAPLALTVDFESVAVGVAPGSASAYAQVNASGAARLSVTAASIATPLFLVPDRRLEAGASYSVFLVGTADAAIGIVRDDR